MKKIKRLLTALLCLVVLLSAVPAMQAQATEFEYGPALESPLNQEEKLELMAALYEADIVSAREAIAEGLISCQELTAYYMKRIEDYADPYNCFITICDNAMEVAKQRDADLVAGKAKGDLFGIPVVVKDNIKYAGYPTTNGDKGLLKTKSTTNATVVQRLLNNGAVILGKTNMCYYAYYAGHSTSTAGGMTKNAYSTYLSPGGSSGGSAVAVSLNFGLAALGTDTGSSLRLPAVLNGCYSMRTTHGSISRAGITTLASSKDVVGSINRTVEDLALTLDVLAADTQYYQNLDGNALEGARIGVIKQLSGPTSLMSNNSPRTEKNVNDEVEAAFWNAVEELKACGAEVVEISYPSIFTTDYAAKRSSFASIISKHNLDAVAFPTYLHKPQKLGKDENGKSWSTKTQVFINNCHHVSPPTGCPEIAIPIGFHSNGAGIGMDLAAPRGQDQKLLNYAYSYSLRFDHRVPPTGAPNDYAEYRTGTLKEVMADYREKTNPTWVYEIKDNAVTITACGDENSTQIIVPTQLEGLPVTAISENAFARCGKVQTILIPDTVTSVAANAFSGCASLQTIGFAGDQNAWNALGVATNATVTCGYILQGDYTGDMAVDEADAVYLLRDSLFAENSETTHSDVMELYWYTMHPDTFTLTVGQ